MRRVSMLPEAPRDEAETAFTPVLRRFFDAEPHVLAVIFVDKASECIDYCSSFDALDTKIAGAHLQVVSSWVKDAMQKLAAGEAYEVCIFSTARDVIVRRVDEDYSVVVIVRAGMCDESVMRGVDHMVERLREEAGLEVPWWEISATGLFVRVRSAVGWDFAPEAVVVADRTIEIADVLGRWEERGGMAGGPVICFRVRTKADDELTLAYDARENRWFRW